MQPSRNVKSARLLEQRRAELVEAATEVFVEKGFDRTSVDDIAARCGWSVGGLYRYVSGKDDILVLVCEQIFRRIELEPLDRVPGQTAAERLREAFVAYWSNCTTYQRQVLLMYREYGRLARDAQRRFQEAELRVVRTFEDIVSDGVSRGEFVAEQPHEFAVQCVLLGHTVALKSWAVADGDLSLLGRRTAERLVRALTAGIA